VNEQLTEPIDKLNQLTVSNIIFSASSCLHIILPDHHYKTLMGSLRF